jgi:hypothetical protein
MSTYFEYNVDYSNATGTLSDDLLDQLYDYVPNGFEIEAINEETPMAWDAGFEIIGDKFIMTGAAGGHGFGSCRIEVPKNVPCFKITVVCFGQRERNNFRTRILPFLQELGYVITRNN